MFPNVISPSQLYQTYLRSAANLDCTQGLGQPGPSPSFLVENLLRERNHSLLSRQFPLGRPVLPPQPKSPGEGTRQNPSNSHFLKFGVNAILGSSEEDDAQKQGTLYILYICENKKKRHFKKSSRSTLNAISKCFIISSLIQNRITFLKKKSLH